MREARAEGGNQIRRAIIDPAPSGLSASIVD
jgi:hypothetical protein